LIRLGEYEVRDLYVMTEALDQLPAGTRVDATVLRDGQPLTVSVLLRERPGN
jgi:S1-C subfamily serine protease